jgi:NADH-quinone oxidoreductase subunit J
MTHDHMQKYIFIILGLFAVLSALMVVFTKNPVHSVLYLVLTFFAITGEYILLNAQFIAIVNIIVYAGAIMVLFLFVIMLLNLNKETEPHKNPSLKFAAVITSGLLLLVLVGSLKAVDNAIATPYQGGKGLIQNLAEVLFHQFLVPFEVSSILFLAAMVGAVMLGKKDIK